jgi:hypothetical protein
MFFSKMTFAEQIVDTLAGMVLAVAGFVQSVCFRLLFRDAARPVEFVSMLLLLNWAWFFGSFDDGSKAHSFYLFFTNKPTIFWMAVFLIVSILQAVAISLPARMRRVDELRFSVLGISSGLWCVVAVSFFASGMSTTAEWNYTVLSAMCAITGLYVIWTPVQTSS